MIQQDPYRILICADKFQTGYDEPLLNTMYVDKTLGGIKAVQTLSRLNRQAPNKDRVFVLDFMNNPDAIQEAFEDYYQTTILADETDPNKLHDLRGTLDQRQVYSWEQVDALVEAYLNGANRGQLDPALDLCVEEYLKLDEDGQVEFKSSAKAFTRLYAFLSQVLPYGNATLGETLDIPELPDRQAARPGGAGPLPGSAGSCGYGQLPDGAEGGPEHQPGRGGRRDKPSPPGRWRRSP